MTTTIPAYRTPRLVRRALVVVAALFAVVTIGFGALALLDRMSRHAFVERASYAGVRTLEVHAGTGDVHLTGGPAGSPVRVVAHVVEGLSSPRRRAVRGPAGTLRLSASCPDSPANECDVRYEIVVPAGVAVRASASADDVVGDGLRSSRVTAVSAAGDVRVTLLAPPRRLVARSSAGDVDLTVPDAVYAVHAHSNVGTVADGGVRRKRSAPRSITATSGAGDVRIAVR